MVFRPWNGETGWEVTFGSAGPETLSPTWRYAATLTQFVTYAGGKIIYVGDQSDCMRWRSSSRCDENECWDVFVKEVTYGCLQKAFSKGYDHDSIVLPTLPKI